MGAPPGTPFRKVYRSALVLTDIQWSNHPDELPRVRLLVASSRPDVHHWKDFTWRVDLAKLAHWLAATIRETITTDGWAVRQVRGNLEIHFATRAAAVMVKLALDKAGIDQFLYQETITWVEPGE